MHGVIDVDNLIYIDGLITNYDHTIDKDKEEKLKEIMKKASDKWGWD